MVKEIKSPINPVIKLLNHQEFWAIFILVTLILLRLPTLFEPHRYADEEIYLTLGQALRKGLVFYRDIHDNKPPLLYLLAALAGTTSWFRFILLIWNAINVLIFWFLTQAVLGKVKTWLVGGTTLFFAVLSSIPLTEGNIANGEIFMIMPATFGAYLLWRHRFHHPPLPLLAAGGLFALAFLFKVPVLFDFLGLSIFLSLGVKKAFKTKLKFFISPGFYLLLLGFILPIVATIVYYGFQGAAAAYVKAALLQNISYLSSWERVKTGVFVSLLHSGLWQRGIIVLVITALLLAIQKKLSESVLFVLLWFVFSLFGALLSGRPYPHYLLETLVPLCLMVALLMVPKVKGKLLILPVLFLLPAAVWYYHFWYYKTLPYYQNFWAFAVGKKSKTEFFGFFEGVNRNYQVAGYILKHSSPHEKIFVWGTEPAIYALTNRLPVSRYFVAYHIADLNAWQETMAALTREKPALMVKMLNEPKAFPQLDAFLNHYYVPVKTIDEAVIYRKLYYTGL